MVGVQGVFEWVSHTSLVCRCPGDEWLVRLPCIRIWVTPMHLKWVDLVSVVEWFFHVIGQRFSLSLLFSCSTISSWDIFPRRLQQIIPKHRIQNFFFWLIHSCQDAKHFIVTSEHYKKCHFDIKQYCPSFYSITQWRFCARCLEIKSSHRSSILLKSVATIWTSTLRRLYRFLDKMSTSVGKPSSHRQAEGKETWVRISFVGFSYSPTLFWSKISPYWIFQRVLCNLGRASGLAVCLAGVTKPILINQLLGIRGFLHPLTFRHIFLPMIA